MSARPIVAFSDGARKEIQDPAVGVSSSSRQTAWSSNAVDTRGAHDEQPDGAHRARSKRSTRFVRLRVRWRFIPTPLTDQGHQRVDLGLAAARLENCRRQRRLEPRPVGAAGRAWSTRAARARSPGTTSADTWARRATNASTRLPIRSRARATSSSIAGRSNDYPLAVLELPADTDCAETIDVGDTRQGGSAALLVSQPRRWRIHAPLDMGGVASSAVEGPSGARSRKQRAADARSGRDR